MGEQGPGQAWEDVLTEELLLNFILGGQDHQGHVKKKHTHTKKTLSIRDYKTVNMEKFLRTHKLPKWTQESGKGTLSRLVSKEKSDQAPQTF